MVDIPYYGILTNTIRLTPTFTGWLGVGIKLSVDPFSIWIHGLGIYRFHKILKWDGNIYLQP